jgi:D-alanyl-D-alanine carboxypeptidase
MLADEIVLKKTEEKKKAKTAIKTNNNSITYTQGGTNWWNYPEEILTSDVSGDAFYIVVNKKYRLPSDYVPTDLGTIPAGKVRTVGTNQLKQKAIDALVELVMEARKDGIDLSVASAYRSYQKQKDVYNYYLKKYKYNYDYIDKFSARPGHSEHQLATTVDFSTSSVGDRVGDAFNSTDAAKWLKDNANKFGFYMSYPEGSEQINGYKYESWHYRYYPEGKR